jgi:hypothetical protein
MPFDVVQVGTDEVRVTLETGGEAGRLAASLNAAEIESGSDRRFRVISRKAETPEMPAWWQREYDRICTGEYKPAPWFYEPWFHGQETDNASGNYTMQLYAGKHGHFAHVAKGNPEMVAFTPDDTWGGRDAQKRMRVGRYLTQYYGDVLSNERIQELCANWDTEFGVGLAVKFGSTREEFSHVYQNGPDSCMSHGLRDYNTGDVHPSEVYAAGDLAVAYLENQDRITARAICWPDRMLYGRVYGDTHRMHELMRALDYKHEDHCDSETGFCGARLLKLPHRGGYVMPWLDHVGRVTDNGKFFVIDEDGEYDAQDTSGLMSVRDNLSTCESCSERYDSEDEGGYVDGRDLCESCLESETFYCEGCNDRHIGEAHYSEDLERDYCRDCYNERHSGCHECSTEHASDNMTADVDGNLWCETCAEDATRNEFGEIDETYEPSDDTSDVREPTPTIPDYRQEELPL